MAGTGTKVRRVKRRNHEYSEPFAECSLLVSRRRAVVIPLTRGKVTFIDPGDVPLVTSGYTWSAHRRADGLWYARAYIRGSARGGQPARHIFMHVLIGGEPGIDHRDRDGLNNTRANLRSANGSQNTANQGKRGGTSSRFKGVSLIPRTGRWRATISPGPGAHLGSFATEEEAARVYDRAATAHFGEFAATNVMLGLLPEEG